MRALLEMIDFDYLTASSQMHLEVQIHTKKRFSRLFKFFSQEANSVFKGRKHQLLEGQCRHLSGYHPRATPKQPLQNYAQLC